MKQYYQKNENRQSDAIDPVNMLEKVLLTVTGGSLGVAAYQAVGDLINNQDVLGGNPVTIISLLVALAAGSTCAIYHDFRNPEYYQKN